MSRSRDYELYLLNKPCQQFFVKSKDGKLYEWTDPFFDEQDMLKWFNKWGDYWEAKGRQLFLIDHARHPQKLSNE